MMQSSSSDNCAYHCNIGILYPFHPELQLITTKPMIKNKIKELLSELKRFTVHKILVLDYESIFVRLYEKKSP